MAFAASAPTASSRRHYNQGLDSARCKVRSRISFFKLRRVNAIALEAAVKEDLKQLSPLITPKRTTDFQTLIRRFCKVAQPYWLDSKEGNQAILRLASVFALTLASTGTSVAFSYLGRNFDNALTSKNREEFVKQLIYYLGLMVAALPVYVIRGYARDTLALRWRAWMTKRYMAQYLSERSYYNIQSLALIDNPDQRVVDDIGSFTRTALIFTMTLFHSITDLASFSGILYRIYPPLFGVLLVYSIGGTGLSFLLGKDLMNLNFVQEKSEADFRYGLVRVRENAESIAFYGGEMDELHLLLERFKQVFSNYSKLLIASRNLSFFQVFYSNLIRILPAAVVAPFYFSGKVDFGIVSQSFYAFSSVLRDLSLVVQAFQSLSSFSAVVDRLGEFSDILDKKCVVNTLELSTIKSIETTESDVLIEVSTLTLLSPQHTLTLVEGLSFRMITGQNFLITGPSGSGKTSFLRAIAGLWNSGGGTIARNSTMDIFFVPQKPYMTLGTLRQQILYPTWSKDGEKKHDQESKHSDADLMEVLRRVKLEQLLERSFHLDANADWSSVLSLGEQQRLAFARLLLSKPKLALLDEATSAIDEATEAYLYRLLLESGTCVMSVGHRSTLREFHTHLILFSPQISGTSISEWSLQDLPQRTNF
ncbi:ATP-binding cassette transporter, subfamily D, member 5, SmABCD5 [Selaginella moellendorffii]|uniref:ATP-binding cassette transporter, subfamily D, member 5, SmABCD5 n=1 Tax=Selaginella moellendorffii TaxID=88036 RepID=D8SPT4_SELML|nr:ABC transporter D family member 2, chloroplastic isoform X2 [Selaginella moellendorffii]EFJ13541.1 ATP-binding cassette transporter, subfamily D, member 5, SmABCD5 [Selaginella moellendorffii]|eukprot:XP_002985411.1 ABC transporter D family member 2, chloroplastic isoform X2 [Selaginella moellendorffii]